MFFSKEAVNLFSQLIFVEDALLLYEADKNMNHKLDTSGIVRSFYETIWGLKINALKVSQEQ